MRHFPAERLMVAVTAVAAAMAIGAPGLRIVPGAALDRDEFAHSARRDGGDATLEPDAGSPPRTHSFYFARAAYSFSRGGSVTSPTGGAELMDPRGGWIASQGCDGGFCGWATDYPKADLQLLTVLRRLTNIDASASERAIRLDDPELRRFPLIYAVEVGYMDLTDAEVEGLRAYLLQGGFLIVDDFWGSREWREFEEQMSRVLPDLPIVEIPLQHEVFHAFYHIDEIVQVPNLGQGRAGGPTYERDGYVPHVRGIFDRAGRLLVAINWNTDLGDAWEWAEQPDYPLRYSTYAYQMAVNYIVYAMSH